MRAGGDERAARARALLRRHGIEAAVSAAGREDEVAAVRCDVALRAELARLAPEIRALGFRYVAIELDPSTECRST